MDIIACFGLFLAIGIALDAIVSTTYKQRVISWAEGSSNLTAPADALLRFFDRNAGSNLVSWKAVRFSFVLSTTAFLVMIMAVFLIDGVRAFEDFSVSLRSTSPLILVILPITGLIFIFGDFLSFAQTRLFIKAVNTLSDRYVTLIMLVGDVLSSLLIFVTFAALARLSSYILLVMFLFAQPVKSSNVYIPSVAVATLSSQGFTREKLVKLAKNSDTAKLLLISSQPNDFATNLVDFAKLHRRLYLKDNVFANSITSSATVVCLDYDPDTALTNMELYSAILQSVQLSVGIMQSEGDHVSAVKWKELTKYAAIQAIKYKRGWARCKILSVKIERSINLRNLFSEISPIDLYIASFGLTLNDTLEVVPRKLSEYRTVDPANDIITFAGNAIIASSTSFLSIGGTDNSKLAAINVTNELVADSGILASHTPLPFPTMAAASMVASIIFAFFLLLRMVTRMWVFGFRAMRKSLVIIESEKHVFTYVSLISIAVVTGVLTLLKMVEIGWRMTFSV